TTGRESVTEGAEVEFSILSRDSQIDKAVNVTRPGGGLITEDQQAAKARRLLGSMYKETDTEARIPAEFSGGDYERRQGYIISYNPTALHGYIMPFDDPTELVFISIDDCHIYGKRSLRKFQHVEFFGQKTTSGETKAIHVTGPDRAVLRFNSPNAFVPRSVATKHFEPSDTERHKGIVSRADDERRFFFIKPDEHGYANVFAPNSSVLVSGIFVLF
ncbi:cold-shock DNA binding protein, partial [Reticulomyxa filosa]